MVVNMTKKSIKKLSAQKGFSKEAFKKAFDYGPSSEKLTRTSYREEDQKVESFICSLRFKGWAWTRAGDRKGHHPEVMLCANDSLVRHDEELRFDLVSFTSFLLIKGDRLEKIVPYSREKTGTNPDILKAPIGEYGSYFLDQDKVKTKSDKLFIDALRGAMKEGKIKHFGQ
jgi:hypothetical protein